MSYNKCVKHLLPITHFVSTLNYKAARVHLDAYPAANSVPQNFKISSHIKYTLKRDKHWYKTTYCKFSWGQKYAFFIVFDEWHLMDIFYPLHFTASRSSRTLMGNVALKRCSVSAMVLTPIFHRTICLCQPCQDLPKGVACQSAKCVRARQKPGRITSPAWPGAPSCPWTTAQLWTGNKRWEISYKPTVVPHRTKRLFFITWAKRNYNVPQAFLKLYPLVQDSFSSHVIL